MSEQDDSGGKPERLAIISPNTLIPLGTLVAIVAIPFAAMQWLSTKFDEVKVEQQKFAVEITKRVDVMESGFKDQNRTLQDRWTLNNQTVWYLEMRQRNPTLSMPDPRNIVSGAATP